ncbi:hypothetical protein UFOVP638_46 [uncultured Caudovirales phage]|uniref:Uncharacterized protein n=1 Tax=uncultured Caudovirales phage TaxID=2100421 RepID=A0A6J5NAC6_9CAUD|nr:hypothetical protein UFOVP638_46 [uncultured Caudovirales phage]
METKQAIEILVQVAHIAQKGGLLQLADAVAVAEAIKVVAPVEEQKEVEKELVN